ncbi:hypothetical protein KFE98_14945 [bacterium SCSIO 12741]|nr:hypothetical protein KFE98_14945 [bacterium SCSIO 12741]
MILGFENLSQQTTELNEFKLKWRFTEEEFDVLPAVHLDQLQPLNSNGAQFLWDYISHSGLHKNTPFDKDFFSVVDKAKIREGKEKEIKKWLYQRGIPFEKRVFLSWQPDCGMIVPWKILIKYFDSFYYGGSDDLTIIDESLNWALLFYHEDEIYFGTNKKFEPSDSFEDVNFLW